MRNLLSGVLFTMIALGANPAISMPYHHPGYHHYGYWGPHHHWYGGWAPHCHWVRTAYGWRCGW
jgi:hypothetical protein